jgi:hypothetical protein
MHKGAVPKPIPIGQPEPLIAADLERLKEKRYAPSTPQKLRDSHHMIARLRASGLRGFQIAERMGYSAVRVNDLLNSPAMEELVAQYRAKVDESFVENTDAFFSLATSNMLAAERHIRDQIDQLDEAGELLPVRTALAISRDAADRFGYGKKSQQTNINVDFASALEKAIARSGKGPTIEGASTSTPPVERKAPPLPRSEPRLSPPSASAPPPLLRRRA